jgi:acyl-CoA reductase-like NAD-dependent aldehyde dehydrogenase
MPIPPPSPETWRRQQRLRQTDRRDEVHCDEASQVLLGHSLEGSRPPGSGVIEMIDQLGGWYHYYAGLADKLEGRQIPAPNPNYLVYTRREPVGVVAAITPWNSPLLLMTWKLAAGCTAGCTAVVKPSEHSAGLDARGRRATYRHR